MQQRWVGYALVAAQFAVLIYLAATGPWWARGGLLVLEIGGAGLGLWALAAMRRSKLNVAPHVRPGARLVANGPYRWIRHPMYSALLLIGLALVWSYPSPGRWLALVLLGLVLMIKLHYEERLLTAAFPDYTAYQARSKRLIPFLY